MFFPAKEVTYNEPNPKKCVETGVLKSRSTHPSPPHMRTVFVKFKDGAYTKWHFHTGEQFLMATEDSGFIEIEELIEGLSERFFQKGDRVIISKINLLTIQLPLRAIFNWDIRKINING